MGAAAEWHCISVPCPRGSCLPELCCILLMCVWGVWLARCGWQRQQSGCVVGSVDLSVPRHAFTMGSRCSWGAAAAATSLAQALCTYCHAQHYVIAACGGLAMPPGRTCGGHGSGAHDKRLLLRRAVHTVPSQSACGLLIAGPRCTSCGPAVGGAVWFSGVFLSGLSHGWCGCAVHSAGCGVAATPFTCAMPGGSCWLADDVGGAHAAWPATPGGPAVAGTAPQGCGVAHMVQMPQCPVEHASNECPQGVQA